MRKRYKLEHYQVFEALHDRVIVERSPEECANYLRWLKSGRALSMRDANGKPYRLRKDGNTGCFRVYEA